MGYFLAQGGFPEPERCEKSGTPFTDAYADCRRFSAMSVWYHDYWVARLLAEIPGSSRVLLELMCGGGEITRRAHPRFSSIFAVDLEPKPLEDLARDLEEGQASHVHITCADARLLPLADSYVDAIAIMGGLHHVRPVLDSVAAEIRRVLRPGGVLVASEPANDHTFVRAVRHWQYRHSSRQGFDEGEDGFSRTELDRLFRTHGLRLERYFVFGFLAYPLMGNTDLLPLLARSRSSALGRFLLAFDGALEKVPLIRNLGWASIFRALKPAKK